MLHDLECITRRHNIDFRQVGMPRLVRIITDKGDTVYAMRIAQGLANVGKAIMLTSFNTVHFPPPSQN